MIPKNYGGRNMIWDDAGKCGAGLFWGRAISWNQGLIVSSPSAALTPVYTECILSQAASKASFGFYLSRDTYPHPGDTCKRDRSFYILKESNQFYNTHLEYI